MNLNFIIEWFTKFLNYIFSPELTWLKFLGLIALGMIIQKQIDSFIIGMGIKYAPEILETYITKAKKDAVNNNNDELNKLKAIQRRTWFNEENILREKQEIIKRNTEKDDVCGLCKDGECEFVGYCKYQRKYKQYADKSRVLLCMRNKK